MTRQSWPPITVKTSTTWARTDQWEAVVLSSHDMSIMWLDIGQGSITEQSWKTVRKGHNIYLNLWSDWGEKLCRDFRWHSHLISSNLLIISRVSHTLTQKKALRQQRWEKLFQPSKRLLQRRFDLTWSHWGGESLVSSVVRWWVREREESPGWVFTT